MYSQCCWVIPFYRAVLLRYVSHFQFPLLPTSPSNDFLAEDSSEEGKMRGGWGHDTRAQVHCNPPHQLVLPEDNGKKRHKAGLYTAFLKCCWTPTCYNLWLHSCSEFKQFSVGVLYNVYFRAVGIDFVVSYVSLMAKHYVLVKCQCQSKNL